MIFLININILIENHSEKAEVMCVELTQHI